MFWSEGISHGHTAERVKDSRYVSLLQANVRVPCEAWLLKFLRLILLQHTTIEPKANRALSEVEHNTDRALRRRQKLLSDGVVLGHFLWVESHAEIYSQTLLTLLSIS